MSDIASKRERRLAETLFLPALIGLATALSLSVAALLLPTGWTRTTVALVAGAAAALLSVGGALLAQRAALRGASRRWERKQAAADDKISWLQAEGRQFREIVVGMNEGILVVDAQREVVFTNEVWREKVHGSTRPTSDSVLRPSDNATIESLLSKTLETGRPQRAEIEIGEPATTTLILASSPLVDSGGAVVIAQDVTEVLRFTQMRRDFVANVSHELKTPLSAIRGYAETLADGAVEDAEASGRFLERILLQCSRLEALLVDLLTLSRLEHSQHQGSRAPIDLTKIVGDAVEELQTVAAERGVALEVELAPTTVIEGDGRALERMTANLIENAIKYNRDGGRVSVRLRDAAESLVLEVSDTGIGIPETSLDRLFERFYRVDKGRSRGEGGTGLGLAIVKHAANLHGGTVDVESRLGEGSLFRVRLPVTRPEAASAQP